MQLLFVRFKGVVVLLKEETKGIMTLFSRSKGEKVRTKKTRKKKIISQKSVRQRKAEFMAMAG